MSKPTPQTVPENLPWKHEKNLKYVNKRHDIRFGDVIIYKDETTQRKVIKKEKKSGDKSKLTQDVMLAQERMKLQSLFIQKMLGWSVSTEKGLCSTNHYVGMFFDYPSSDLRNEVAERKKKKLGMSDGELSNIVSNSLRGLDYIHSRGLAHGDIRPELIGCERDKGSKSVGHSALLDRLADQSSVERVQTNRMINKKQMFMSPQLFKLINTKGKNKPLYNRQKNDLFALGMTILSAGNGSSVNNCYIKGGDFNQDKLNEHKKKFNEKYQRNPDLCRVVSDLLQIDEDKRPDPSFLARGPQVVYQEMIDPRTLNDEVEETKNAGFNFNKKRVEVNNSPRVQSNQPHPLDHEEHYVKPGEEVVYGEPKVVRTYVDENTRRAQKGDVQNEVVKLKNAYDPNKHEVEPQVNTQFQSRVPPTEYKSTQPVIYKKQAPTYTSEQPKQTYTYNQPTTTTYVNSQPTTTYGNAQPVTTTYVNGQPTTIYENTQPVTTYVDNQPTTYVNAQPTTTTYVNGQPTTTYVNTQPTTTYVNTEPTTTYVNGQPTTTYVNAHPTTTYVDNQPTKTTYVNGQPVTTYTNYEPKENYVNASPTMTGEPAKKDSKKLEYVISERDAIEFHNLKFKNVNQSETEPENRFEEPVKSRIAESGEDMNSFPPEGKVVRKRIKIKNAEGEIVEEYDEPVK